MCCQDTLHEGRYPVAAWLVFADLELIQRGLSVNLTFFGRISIRTGRCPTTERVWCTVTFKLAQARIRSR